MIRVQILAPLVASYSLVSSLYFTCKVEIIILPPRICRIQREDLNIKCQHTASDMALERELSPAYLSVRDTGRGEGLQRAHCPYRTERLLGTALCLRFEFCGCR